ncbi:MAG: hypothetical protein IPH45_13575 [Bacteroidales bacterium]|nr:hypothetical protein [Bacteroidales bacterium]MBK7172446.1 hypothetical protein [Bacteroidales bacterium]
MRIVTSLFDSIEGIYWFPMVALFLFVLIFILMTVYTLTMNKGRDEELSRMPLDPNEPDSQSHS